MVLIIGGAYQGKRAFALSLGYPPERIVPQAELVIRGLMADGKDPVQEMPALCDAWKDHAVLLEDISCGVVPMDAEDRAWREAVGRCGAMMAQKAERVVRVFCGLGTDLKHA